jgi:hypothetical protein
MPTPTRAEFERLKADSEQPKAAVDALVNETRSQRAELQIQFKRIAEMQAILDEERRRGSPYAPPNSLAPSAFGQTAIDDELVCWPVQ